VGLIIKLGQVIAREKLSSIIFFISFGGNSQKEYDKYFLRSFKDIKQRQSFDPIYTLFNCKLYLYFRNIIINNKKKIFKI
jgi:hypothetical protein